MRDKQSSLLLTEHLVAQKRIRVGGCIVIRDCKEKRGVSAWRASSTLRTLDYSRFMRGIKSSTPKKRFHVLHSRLHSEVKGKQLVSGPAKTAGARAPK